MLENCYVSFVNLDSREDRLKHMISELNRIDLKAVRTRGILPSEYTGPREKIATMASRPQIGAIGCHFSQVSIMKEALRQGKHAFVMEDDLIFCSDFHERVKIIEDFLEGRQWDIAWLGAAFHVNPPFWHPKGPSGMKPNCSFGLGYDAKCTDNPRMMRTYGAFATFAYIVNIKSIQKILDLFDRYLSLSIGIDWLTIKLQPQLKCFSFVPGCVKQMDGRSDIGIGNTIWSGFLKLGPYVWQDKMTDFNPTTFNWAECR